MRYFKPFTTLAVGMVLGYVIGPRVASKLGK